MVGRYRSSRTAVELVEAGRAVLPSSTCFTKNMRQSCGETALQEGFPPQATANPKGDGLLALGATTV